MPVTIPVGSSGITALTGASLSVPTLAEIPIQLERPGWLLLLLLIVPVVWMSLRSVGSVSRGKAWTTALFRAAVLLLLTVAVCQPSWVKRGEGLTLMMVVDVSQSIPADAKPKIERYLRDVGASKRRPEDRIGVLVVARNVETVALPDELTVVSAPSLGADLTATDLAAGIRQAKSILPQDTANRILLVSDGNETLGNVLAEAELCRANGIPVDVLPIEYEHRNEVIFESIRAPARARVGQSQDLRLFIRSEGRVPGRVQLWRNDEPIDLDPQAPGTGLAVVLEPGPNVLTVPLSYDEAGTQQFRAVFEPDDPAATDSIAENNVGVAVTFVSGEGRVLVIHSNEAESAPLVSALRHGGLEVAAIRAEEFTGGLPYLNGFDGVALVNVPRWNLNVDADSALHSYVNDLGGGLIMIGGPESFGAGGWIETQVAKALPVELDPPQTRQMPRGALCLVMHSCEIPQGNFWSEKIAIAAIEALSRLDYVGINVFGFGQGVGLNGIVWAFPMQLVGDRSAAIAAAKSMSVGDMPDFGASLQLAFDGLMSVNAGQRHVILISDGDPQPPSTALLRSFADNKITITTVMVAGHGTGQDLRNMQAMATVTGGQFYNVTNPKTLPQIFVKEAQLVARSLIVETTVQPTVATRLPGPASTFTSFPPLAGYVLTAQRQGLAVTPLVSKTAEADDPLFAWQNYGLGKTVAWTSDCGSRWASAWTAWPRYADFWEEVFRWLMRPPTPQNVELRTRVEGDKAIVELEAFDEKAGFVNFLRTDGRVVKPDGTSENLVLQQFGPGRYRGEFPADGAGAYLVNIAFAGGVEGRAVNGNVQAAVAIPYSREFRAVRDNRALLRTVADVTGGRVMTMGDPGAMDYFAREKLEIPRSAKRVWDILAILAAALFVLDVAVRRIAVEPEAVAAAMQRLARARGATGEGTVEAWKRARTQADRRAGTGARGEGAAPVDPGVAARRFEVDQAQGSALDVAAETSGETRERPAAPPRSDGAADSGKPGAPGEAQYTSRLLQAKRRAQSEKQPEAGAPATPPPAPPESKEGDRG